MGKILLLLLLLLDCASSFSVSPPVQVRSFARPSSSSSFSRPTSTALQHSHLVDTLHYALSALDSPLTTKALSSGVLCGFGDALAQTKEQMTSMQNGQAKPFDMDRFVRFSLTGLGSGVIWSLWYDWADAFSGELGKAILGNLGMGGGLAALRTSLCIFLDQFVGSPTVYGLWSIPIPLLLSGKSLGRAAHQVHEKLPGLLVENAKVWTLANVVIYNVPLEWRVLAMSLTNVLWQTIMSSALSKNEGPMIVDSTTESNMLAIEDVSVVAQSFDSSYEQLAVDTLYVNYNLTDAGGAAVV